MGKKKKTKGKSKSNTVKAADSEILKEQTAERGRKKEGQSGNNPSSKVRTMAGGGNPAGSKAQARVLPGNKTPAGNRTVPGSEGRPGSRASSGSGIAEGNRASSATGKGKKAEGRMPSGSKGQKGNMAASASESRKGDGTTPQNKKRAEGTRVLGSKAQAGSRKAPGSKAATGSNSPSGRKTSAGDRAFPENRAAAGRQNTGRKKAGGNARKRNPNLRLVKDENGPVAAENKNTVRSQTSPKRRLAEEGPAQGTYSPKTSAEEEFSRKASRSKKAAKAGYLKEAPREKIPAGKSSVEKKREKKSSVGKAAVKNGKAKDVSAKNNYTRQAYEEDVFISEPLNHRQRMGIAEWFIQHKSLIIIWFMVLAVVTGLTAAYYYVITNYKVTTVYVDGNVHYTNEEIMDFVMTGHYGDNSLYLALKYKDRGVEDVPFVEKMDVNILNPNVIRINVYEKALAGYVEYLGRYMYFDKDGIIVESSQEKTAGIPQVTGLQFGYVILNEPLPVENDTIFKRILSITQLLDKYELASDKIYFDSAYNLTLYFEGVRVTLGSSEEIDEKIMRLQYILPELAGKSGTLSMENYTEDTKLIPFHQD